MLKRNNSFEDYISKIQSESLSRSKSFHSLPPDNILKANVNYNNPRLINGYIPTVRETSLEEIINTVKHLYESIKEGGWTSHIKNVTERKDEICKKNQKTREDAWDMRCCMTYNLLEKLQKLLNILLKTGCFKNHAYFVCHINTQPIGVMLLRKYYSSYSRVTAYYPEVNFLINHPGIQNCAYLLMEKAVNTSYKIGYQGKLKLTLATDELSSKVYQKMGFTHIKGPDNNKMELNPNGNSVWYLSPSYGGYFFTGIRRD
ncbi:hypothetical protein [Xenorhabdus bovienii]|uniref:hypothetical protein n=1 Tax=Xenorhabdus bovienii TaxID=40576 RepID=UPI0023B25A46|nr:hypothetical protein [Xenorhabdus bovienii]MDE9454333.1 hypothetical protein [Xenorhabdus bovienii]